MDTRKKLVGILKAASMAVGQNSAMSKDLNTMSLALASMTAEKFASRVDSTIVEEMLRYAADCIEDEKEAGDGNGDAVDGQEDASSEACWNAKAASLVRAKLARDVLGFDTTLPEQVKGTALTKEQTMDGTHSKGTLTGMPGEVSGTALTKEQTMDDAARLKTDMVAKSHGAINTLEGKAKEAATPEEMEAEAASKKVDEEMAAEASKKVEEDMAAESSDQNSYHFAGVEMSERANVEAATLNEAEASELKNLFG